MRLPIAAHFILAILAAVVAAAVGAIRPVILTALINEEAWQKALLGRAALPDWLASIPTIVALLSLEIVEALALLLQGVTLAIVATGIARSWRGRLARGILHSMSAGGDLVQKYLVLSKTYIEVVELFHRQYLIPTIAAGLQLVFAVAIASTVGTEVALLLLAQIVCLLSITTLYAGIHVSLAQRRLAADEALLSGTALNPRRGISIWFGGVGSFWFRTRLREIKALARARLRLNIGEVSYLNVLTLVVGLFTVLGFAVIVEWGHHDRAIFLAYLLYSGLMMGPVVRLSSFIPECREYLMVSSELKKSVDGERPSRIAKQGIVPVSFSASGIGAHGRVSQSGLSIEAGERVIIVGGSGSGKTATIESLLGARTGFWDDANVGAVQSSDARRYLPYLGVRYLTESASFERGTVLRNCLASQSECNGLQKQFGLFPGATDAWFDDFLRRILSVSGEPLSLGERQRVQLMRALVTRPSVLIMDEALSGIEEDLERKIVTQLMSSESISILIYVSHRSSVQDLFPRKIFL